MSVGSFGFSSFTSNVGTCYTDFTFPVSFFTMFHVFTIFFSGGHGSTVVKELCYKLEGGWSVDFSLT